MKVKCLINFKCDGVNGSIGEDLSDHDIKKLEKKLEQLMEKGWLSCEMGEPKEEKPKKKTKKKVSKKKSEE